MSLTSDVARFDMTIDARRGIRGDATSGIDCGEASIDPSRCGSNAEVKLRGGRSAKLVLGEIAFMDALRASLAGGADDGVDVDGDMLLARCRGANNATGVASVGPPWVKSDACLSKETGCSLLRRVSMPG